MSDLISRKVLIENIWSIFNNTYNDASRFEAEETELAKRILCDTQKVIEKQQTAYDVDKVVEQLEEKILNTSDSQLGIATRMAFGKAIEIVKSGGVADKLEVGE